ncbi:hypothetical protein FNV43_RR17055 [Rhamnella rubrinervis]|uniref:Uncharacterized protein n=1 Tax=Rhamnella rubrinervis TaxID=2594499 RepID=A0A8K0MD29_9ROSA|nr:hypothetical protein FNV43_RR17055 [Rhamnella rubrinervis]
MPILGLEDNHSLHVNTSKLAQNNLYGHVQFKLVEQYKLFKADDKALKVTITEANAKMQLLEQNWSEANHKLGEAKRELTTFRLDYTQAAAEKNKLWARMTHWCQKKKNVYHKGAMDAILKTQNDVIWKFMAKKNDWTTPELREEEDGELAFEKISSKDDEPDEDKETSEHLSPIKN